jgi:hypothetical protein
MTDLLGVSWVFGLKVGLSALAANLAGIALYWRGARVKARGR